MDKARFETFSDGVFAVAITLLALDLVVAGPGHGNGTLVHQLADRWPSFAAYVVSFFTIGIIAVNHHVLFKTFAAVDRALVFFNSAHIVAIGIAFVSAPASLVITALVAIYYVFEQTPDGSPDR